MVDALIWEHDSSGQQLDNRYNPSVPNRQRLDFHVNDNESNGNGQTGWRFIDRVKERSSPSANDSDINGHLLKILEDLKPSGWLAEYSAHIDQLSKLPIGWDSYGSNPPNVIAARTAREILDSLWKIDMPPSRVAPLADEGIVIWLMLDDRRISIESLNSGTTVFEINNPDGSLDKAYENKTATEIADILDSAFPQTEIAATADVSSDETGESELLPE